MRFGNIIVSFTLFLSEGLACRQKRYLLGIRSQFSILQHSILNINCNSPLLSGQSLMLQDLYCTRFPSQYFPPLFGIGLSHSLTEYWTPPPHVLEHSPHCPHGPQPPWTGVYILKKNKTNLASQTLYHNTHTAILNAQVQKKNTYIIMFLVYTLAIHTPLPLSTASAICPRKVFGLAYEQSSGDSSTPQCCTCAGCIRTMFGFLSKGELALPVGIIHCSREIRRELYRLMRFVKQTFT